MKNQFLYLSSRLKIERETFRESFPLQFITHYTEAYDYVASARLALEGGCRWIQLRMKDATDEEFRKAALEIGPLCKKYNAVFLLNDRVDLVRELHADGVHLGKSDLPVREARSLLGDLYIIGGTANTFDEVARHYADGATYAGCGPLRFTTTKKNLSPVLGLDGYASICTRVNEESILIPLVAIGGITAEDIPALLSTGVSGIALSGTVLRAGDPSAEMKRIKALIENSEKENDL